MFLFFLSSSSIPMACRASLKTSPTVVLLIGTDGFTKEAKISPSGFQFEYSRISLHRGVGAVVKRAFPFFVHLILSSSLQALETMIIVVSSSTISNIEGVRA